MLDSLFGKKFAIIFISITALEIASFFAHQFVWLNIIFFTLICAVAAVLSVWRPDYGFYFLLAELFVGSKGHLFFLEIDGFLLSIRMGLFAVIFLVWFLNLLKGQGLEFFKSAWLGYYLALLLFISLAAVNGILNNELSNVFFDLNGWLYFLIAPAFFWAIKSRKAVQNTFTVLMASVAYLSAKTIIVSILFAGQFNQIGDVFYRWLRNSGVGEITYVTGDFYRIFFQAHIYVLIGLLVILVLLIFKKYFLNDRMPLIITSLLAGLALLISSSRSLWLGFLAGLAMLFSLLIFKYQTPIKKVAKTLALIILITLTEIILVSAVVKGFGQTLLGGRFDFVSEPASVSRLQQLKPLKEAIFQKPWLGSGFGHEVTYVSHDPRIRGKYADGRYKTYSFEWGFLDIWLKLGLFGVLAYFLLMVKIATDAWKSGFLGKLVFIGLIALIVVHTFSPYLNHPLGIGFLLLISAIIHFNSHESKNSQAGR